jgi:hypothetical protein
VRPSEGGLMAELGNGQTIDQSITRNKILGRVEHGMTKGYVDYFIEEQLLKSYCASTSFGYAGFQISHHALFGVLVLKRALPTLMPNTVEP